MLRIDSDGALFNNGESNGMVAPFAAEVVDTIGAGDTHAGGVLAGLSSGWELADAVLLGNAVASYVVSHEAEIVPRVWRKFLTTFANTESNFL